MTAPAPEPAPAESAGRATWVCWAILVGSVAEFVVDRLGSRAWLGGRLALYGPYVARGDWWRPFTAVFVHANLMHLVFNMVAVWSLGRMVESSIGSARFLVATVVGAMGSAFVVLVWRFDQPTVGVSGVILGWMGAILPIATRAGRRQLGVWLAQIFFISLLPQVSGAAHAGGFLFGLPCGWLMRRPRGSFRTLAPLLVLATAVLLYLAGSGRFGTSEAKNRAIRSRSAATSARPS
jgi:membrane associated rhomboid family serine protease